MRLSTKVRRVWKENRAKKFTVRTVYLIAVHLKNPSYAEHSSAQCHGPTRGKIWRLNVPPKVRTLYEGLALTVYRLKVEAKCEICCQNVWSLSNGRTQNCRNEAIDFFLLFEQMRKNLDQLELGRWATMA